MKKTWRKSIFVALMVTCAMAAHAKSTSPSLLDMSDQLDGLDKQDFQAAIDRTNTCTRARNFSCSESELAKAAKSATSSQDQKTLAAARQNIVNEKARIAEEERQRADERRRMAEAEERRQAAEERARERERQAQREREDREAARAADAANMAAIQANIADGMGRINAMDQGIASAMAESRRIQYEQAAAQSARSNSGATFIAPPPRKFTPGVAMGSPDDSGDNGDGTDSNANSSKSGTSTSGKSNSGSVGSWSPAKQEKKYKWTANSSAQSFYQDSEEAACKQANEEVDKANLSGPTDDSRVISKGSCECSSTQAYGRLRYICRISYQVARASIYSNTSSGPSSAVSR